MILLLLQSMCIGLLTAYSLAFYARVHVSKEQMNEARLEGMNRMMLLASISAGILYLLINL